MNSYTRVQGVDQTGNRIETTTIADPSGINVERQTITFPGSIEGQILETMQLILNELRAIRIQDSQGYGVRYEATETLIES